MLAAWVLAANLLLAGPQILLHVEDGGGMTREAFVQALEIRGVEVVDDPFATLVTVTPAPAGAGCRIMIRGEHGATLADQTLSADPDLARTAALMVQDVLKTEAAVQAQNQYNTHHLEYLPLVEMGTQGGNPLDMATLFRRMGHREYARSAGHREGVAVALLAAAAAADLGGDAIFYHDLTSRRPNLVAGGSFLVGSDLLSLGLLVLGGWRAIRTNPLSDEATQALVDEHNEDLREDLGVPAPRVEP
jgi:hypothetical protein